MRRQPARSPRSPRPPARGSTRPSPRPPPAQDRGLGGGQRRARTPWSSRRPARARRSPRSSGRSTGSPPSRAPTTRGGAAGCSTSRRSRRSPSTSSATCAPRCRHPAGGRPARPARARHHASAIRSGDTPADERRAFGRPAARHPHHHARVAVPAAHLAGPRGAARRRDGDRRRGARRRRHQARRAPRALASSGSTRCSTGPAQRIGLSATVRPVDEVATVPRRRPRRSTVVQPPSTKTHRPRGRRAGRGHDRARARPTGERRAARPPASQRARRSGRTSRSGSSTWSRRTAPRSCSPTPAGSPSGCAPGSTRSHAERLTGEPAPTAPTPRPAGRR